MYQKQTFPIPEEVSFTPDGIGAWVEDFHAGKLTPQEVAVGTADESMNNKSILDAWKNGGAQKDEL